MENVLFKQNNKGFTLIELIVAIALFGFVAVVMVGAMLSVINANAKTQALSSATNSLNFAMESMVRELRVGNSYNCSANPVRASTNNCSGGSRLGFVSSDNEYIVFNFNAGANQIERCKTTPGGASCASPFLDLTGANVTVNAVDFYVFGSSNADDIQPRVTIVIQGTAGDSPAAQTDFNIQTTVTQRFPDR